MPDIYLPDAIYKFLGAGGDEDRWSDIYDELAAGTDLKSILDAIGGGLGSDVVHRSGAETVTGSKTFTADVLFGSAVPRVSLKAKGAAMDGITDDIAALDEALLALPATGGIIEVDSDAQALAIGSRWTITKPVRLVRAGPSGWGAIGIKAIAAISGAMVKVNSGVHGCRFENIVFDCNALADIGLHYECLSGQSSKAPYLDSLEFKGYLTRGLVMGENNTSTLKTGQFEQIHMNNITFRGGGAASTIGFLLNAQNCEWDVCSGLYFDPYTAGSGGPYYNHDKHIFTKAGGLSIKGMTTTRSDTLAVEVHERCHISDWTAEDTKLFKSNAVSAEGPITLDNITHRAGAVVAAGNNAIELKNVNGPVSIRDSSLRGYILLGATDARYLRTDNVAYVYAADADIVCQGPKASSYINTDAANSKITVQGDSASLRLRNKAETSVVDLTIASGNALALTGGLTISAALDHDGTTVGFFGVTPATRPAATDDIKDALTTMGLLQGTSATPLNLDGGALTAGAISGTGYTLTNDNAYVIKDSGGTNRNMVKLTASDTMQFGTTASTSASADTQILAKTNVVLRPGAGTTTLTLSTTAMTLVDAVNIAVGTTTGTKIGTATSQKLGFFNATPVVQRTLAAAATDAATTQALANSLRTALIDLGLGA